MSSDASTDASSRRGRGGLGLFKSIVEFFTSLTGFAAAGVGLLGAVAAFAIADVKTGGQDPAVPTPAPPGNVDDGTTREAWVRDVNAACTQVAAVGLSGFAQGDASAAANGFSSLAAALTASPTPSGLEDDVATAADELNQAAAAVSLGDSSVVEHANAASAALNAAGATAC
jgi:hypothetical protein